MKKKITSYAFNNLIYRFFAILFAQDFLQYGFSHIFEVKIQSLPHFKHLNNETLGEWSQQYDGLNSDGCFTRVRHLFKYINSFCS